MTKCTEEGEQSELIAKAKAGDRAAKSELFRIIKPQLDDWSAHLLRRGTIGIERQSDIVQEVAIQAFDGLPEFRGSSSKELWGWLRTILERRIAAAIRNAGRKKRDAARAEPLRDSLLGALQASQPSPSQEYAEAQQWRRLLGQVFYLPDEQREAVVLCLFKRRTVQEAAAEKKCTRAVIVGRLQRAVQRLQGKLAHEEGRLTDELDMAGKALLTYLERRDRGECIERAAFLGEYSECGEQLAEMLDWLVAIETCRPPADNEGR